MDRDNTSQSAPFYSLRHSGRLDRIRYFVLIVIFADLTALSARINVPLPLVPMSMQTAVVLLSGALLGSRAGAASQFTYLVMGLAGLPVFVSGGGLSYVLVPTFGYLVGFVLGAAVTGAIVEHKTVCRYYDVLAAMLAGLAVIYAVGLLYLYLNLRFIQHQEVAAVKIIKVGALVPLPGDLLKIIAAAAIVKPLDPFFRACRIRKNKIN